MKDHFSMPDLVSRCCEALNMASKSLNICRLGKLRRFGDGADFPNHACSPPPSTKVEPIQGIPIF